MRIKKRYYVLCVLLCIVALGIAAAVFYFEMCLAHFSRYNDVMTNKWHQTSKSEPYNGALINTNYVATKVQTVEERNTDLRGGDKPVKPYTYIGSTVVVTGKYKAYGKDIYSADLIVYGDPRTDADKKADMINGKEREFGFGSRFTVYYKPDNPRMLGAHVNVTPYIIIIGVLIILAVPIIFVSRLLNNRLSENTFSDKKINIMDIPIAVVVGGVVLGFFIGMLVGNLSIGSEYTEINESIVEQYEDGSLSV